MTGYAAEFDQVRARMPAETYEECDEMRNTLDDIRRRMRKDKTPVDDRTLDAIAAIAALSPYKDIHDGEFYHEQTPQITVCLHALRYFVQIAHSSDENAAPAVARLEALMRDNLDFEVRKEAAGSLWMLTMWQGAAQELAMQALERQGRENDCHYIRMKARDDLLQTAREHPFLAERAWAAQIGGAEDPHPEARTRALALLTNRVKEEDCSYKEANSLMTLFQQAAARQGHEEEAVQYWADRGIADIQKRRLEDYAFRGCTTLEDVKPSKPIKFQQQPK